MAITRERRSPSEPFTPTNPKGLNHGRGVSSTGTAYSCAPMPRDAAVRADPIQAYNALSSRAQVCLADRKKRRNYRDKTAAIRLVTRVDAAAAKPAEIARVQDMLHAMHSDVQFAKNSYNAVVEDMVQILGSLSDWHAREAKEVERVHRDVADLIAATTDTYNKAQAWVAAATAAATASASAPAGAGAPAAAAAAAAAAPRLNRRLSMAG